MYRLVKILAVLIKTIGTYICTPQLLAAHQIAAYLYLATVNPARAEPAIQAANTDPIRQGSQVFFNGQTWPAAWRQWQWGTSGGSIRTGIIDASLIQRLGVELLKNKTLSEQPVRWFSDPTLNPLELPTQLSRQYRYLDITDLATRYGWQMSVDADILKITAPQAKVEAIRQGRHPWGDRIVLDLDRSTSWQVEMNPIQKAPEPEDPNPDNVRTGPQQPPEPMQEFKVTVNAELSFVPKASANELSLSLGKTGFTATVKTGPNQTTISLRLPISWRPRVWTQPNPSRLIVDIRPDSLQQRDILWAPGLQWRQQIVSLGNDQFPLVWLEIEPRSSRIDLRPIWSQPTKMEGIAQLAQTAEREGAVAAINGGFFNRNNQLPLGAIRRDSRWLSSPILNRGAIAWNDAGNFKIGRLTLQETLLAETGQSWPVLFLNSGYAQAGISRYTTDWGSTYTPLSNNETIVVVNDGQVTQQLPGSEAGKTAFPIPSNGYLLAIRANATAVAFPNGTRLRVETATVPADFATYPHILGAGPLLLQNGQIVLNAKDEKFNDNFIQGKASRSAIGTTAAGTILIVAAHNRVAGPGPTLTEMAQLMLKLGAIDALNLDGGGSTTLYLGGQLLEHPPRIVPRVHNGIGVFLAPPQ